jgi:protein SCO1/2
MKLPRPLPYAALLLALAAGIAVSYHVFDDKSEQAPKTDAFQFHPPKAMPEFSLNTAAGQAFNRAALQGHWSLLYFGYTHCPDVCPTTLTDLDHMLMQLKDLPASQQPQVYFISVDPKRDDPKLVSDYAHYFNPGFTGVTGDVAGLRALAKPLGVDFSYDPADAKGDYGVNHSALVILVDPRSEEAALFTPPLIPAHAAADFRTILADYGDH